MKSIEMFTLSIFLLGLFLPNFVAAGPLDMLTGGGSTPAAQNPEESKTIQAIDATDMGMLNSQNRRCHFPASVSCESVR